MLSTESSKHLFHPPRYQCNGSWFNSFEKAIEHAGDNVTLDTAAIQSYLSFGYICGDRTLVQEIKRQPWLSKIKNGKAFLEEIPNHDFYEDTYDNLAKRLFYLLVEEARSSILNFDKVYVLLSGGLDSRIVAGVLRYLYDKGEIKSKPIAVTWGLEDSRDVVYAKKIAKLLNLEIKSIPIDPDIVKNNITVAAKELGLIHSPEMLHNMTWFKDLPKDSIVLAGSFGDSIGRAEFGGLHLLQLNTPTPKDSFNILTNSIKDHAIKGVNEDISKLLQRAPKAQSYMHNEHFMQGYRMRGGLCHALSVINGNANLYQMFTAPEVYSFIWSLHPSMRGDEIYMKLFKNHLPVLANFPWARTNKAFGKKTIGAEKDLRYHYHEYTKWSKNELRPYLEELVDLDWFRNIGVFNLESIIALRDHVRVSDARVGRANDVWLWLAGFRVFVNYLEDSGKKVVIPKLTKGKEIAVTIPKPSLTVLAKKYLFNKSLLLNNLGKKLRKMHRENELRKLKKLYLKKYPPKQIINEK